MRHWSYSRRQTIRRTSAALFSLFILLRPGLSWSGEVTGSVTVGYDSYSENYSFVQAPALTELSEIRTRLTLGYTTGMLLKDYFHIEGQSLIGEESVESMGRANLAYRFGGTRVTFDNALSYRKFHDSSIYLFANDFWRYDLRSTLKQAIGSNVIVGVTHRLEVINFAQRTEFDLDYKRNGIELSADIDNGFTSSYRATAGYVDKTIPDSTGISYGAVVGGLEYRHTFGLNRQIYLTVDAERRTYADLGARSPFWSTYATANIQPITIHRFGIAFENVFESYQYDRTTQVFFNYVENRMALQALYFQSILFKIGVGPTYGFLRSGVSLEDEYTEVGAKVSVDYSSGRRLWLSASWEPGRRDYKLESVTADLIFSDFVYHRLLLFSTLRLWGNASVNVFANIEPEDHKVPTDDSTTTLLSADATYRF